MPPPRKHVVNRDVPPGEPFDTLREIKTKIRNVTVDGKRTSIRMDELFWNGLDEYASQKGITVHHLCTTIAACTPRGVSLTQALRTFVCLYYRDQLHQDYGQWADLPREGAR